MGVIVTDTGFSADDWSGGFVGIAELVDAAAGRGGVALDLPDPALSTQDWARVLASLGRTALIRVAVREVADEAAFDLARRLREAGFAGRLRAHGAVASRFYTLLRRAGFSEVEIDFDQAVVQASEHWHNDPGWRPARGGALTPDHATLV